jgi:hypothetical protein
MMKLILAVILLAVASPAYVQENDPQTIAIATIMMCQPRSLLIKQLAKEGMVPFITAKGSVNAFKIETEKVIPLYGTTEVFINLSALGKYAIVLTVPSKVKSKGAMSCVTGIGVAFQPHPQAMLKGDKRL